MAGAASRGLNRLEEARDAFRTALQSSVDATFAMTDLVNSYPDTAGKRQALEFVRAELARQVTFGQGLVTYRNLASAVVEPADVLAVLREALAARPDLWQAWSTNVYQLCEMNDLDGALATAKEATARFPLLPRTWFDLSHVCGLRGDRTGQIEALGTCLQLSPAWSVASRSLSQAQNQSGDAAAAQKTLERAIARDPLDAANHEALARLHWNRSHSGEAIVSGRRAVLLDPSLTSLWEALRSWTSQQKQAPPLKILTNGNSAADAETDLEELARQVCESRGGEAVAWIVLAQVLQGEERMPERLVACERAIALDPLNAEAHDLKAILLLENKQPQDAIDACNPHAFGGSPPINLRGRAAWIRAQQGEIDAAIQAMSAIIAESTAYHWGWRQLLSWMFKRDGKDDDFSRAASAMVRAFPHDAVAQNYVTSAQLRLKDRAGAKRSLEKTLSITPNDSYACATLFEMQLEDKDFAGADKTLALIQRHARKDYAACRSAMLAAAQDDESRAAEALQQLLSENDANTQLLLQAIGALDKAHMAGLVNQALAEAAKNLSIQPIIVEIWTRRVADIHHSRAYAIVQKFAHEPALFKAAVLPYIDALAKTKKYAVLSRLIRRHRKMLRDQTRLWGAIGFAIFSCGKARPCIGWLSDWPDRADAEPWMLLNLVSALRNRGRVPEAIQVGKAAVDRPADHTTSKHLVWLALDEAINGAFGHWMSKLQNVDIAKLDKAFPFLYQLISALKPLCENDGNKAEKSRAARKAIAQAATKIRTWVNQRELRLSLRRAIRRVPSFHRNPLNVIWAGSWLLHTISIQKKPKGGT